MMNLERLDGALERWEGWELGDPFDAMTLDVLLAAARAYRNLLANGQRVEWCEVHEQKARRGASSCVMESYLAAQGATLADPCRIVSRLLVDPPKEEMDDENLRTWREDR